MRLRYRYFPSRLSTGVRVHGMKLQTGPVTRTVKTAKAMPLETRAAIELGILSSPWRLESYQTFSTDERWVRNLTGERIMRTPPPSNCSPEIFRKRRPDVMTGSHGTKN